MPTAVLSLFVLLSVFVTPGPAPAADDVAGAADHPLISRYPGARIAWQGVQSYDRYRIAVGPRTGYRHIDDWVDVEGKVTRIYYQVDGEHSVSQVHLNYLSALKKGGFELLAEGLHGERNISGEIGGRGWLGVMFADNPPPTNGAIELLSGSSTVGGSGYVAGRLRRDEGDVYVGVASTQQREDRVLVLVDVIEARPVDDDLVHVDAEAMSEDIDKYGKVALYGIFFAHDKATMTDESKPALEEIAALLERRSDLSLYVVGHTDGKGSLQYNMKLSRDRAGSVVKRLITRYGINAHRLNAQGVGPLVPVRSNGDDAGRQANRRVELVQR